MSKTISQVVSDCILESASIEDLPQEMEKRIRALINDKLSAALLDNPGKEGAAALTKLKEELDKIYG
jgi:hypothetical protein